MTPLTVMVDVPDTMMPGRRRVAGMLDDNKTLAIASMAAGESTGTLELSCELVEALALAEAALAGERRALTHPGLARELSATVAVLFRVCLSAGAVVPENQTEGDDGGTGHCGDRATTADDADLD